MVGAIFKLIRWPNLLMIIFIQYLIRYSFTLPLNLPHSLNDLNYFLLVLWSVLQAAGGYIINDIYDAPVDAVNKAKRLTIGKVISENTAWNLFFASLLSSAAIAYWLSSETGLENLWLIAPLAGVLLYFYSSDLQKRPLVGNLIIALLASLPLFLIAVFDLLPATNEDTAEQLRQSLEVLSAYGLFAFWTTLIREIIKDREDCEADHQFGYRTLAIILPLKGLKILLTALFFPLIAAILYYLQSIWLYDKSSSSYVLIAVVAPALWILYQVWQAKEAKHFQKLSLAMKLFMLLGILSMPFFTLSLVLQWP